MMNLNILLVFAALVNAATAADAAPTVELGTAGNYIILAKNGISTVPTSTIYGDVGVSPIAGDAFTGFSMSLDQGGQWSTSQQIIGKAYAANYEAPIPSELTTAVSDMQTAYTDAEGRPNGDGARINLLGGLVGGLTLTPGIYTFTVDIYIATDVTLEGNADDIFIMQTSEKLLQAADTKVILLGGVQAKNIFWQVATSVSVGEGAQMQGVLLAKTDVAFKTGSYLNGRVLTQTACTLQKATITDTSSLASAPTSGPTTSSSPTTFTSRPTTSPTFTSRPTTSPTISPTIAPTDAPSMPGEVTPDAALKLVQGQITDSVEAIAGSDAASTIGELLEEATNGSVRHLRN
jgi:hypothetical protein